MSDSIIIFGGSKKTRKEKAVEFAIKIFGRTFDWNSLSKNPDIRIVEIPNDKKSIGIGDIRDSTKYLDEKPFSAKSKVLVVNDANTLTREAQNALLKTLEEPPSYATILLLTKTLSDLLDTVVSRCKKIQLVADIVGSGAPEENSYARILSMSGGDRLDWAGEYSKQEREDVIELLEKWVAESRQMMLDSPSESGLENLKFLCSTIKELENTNAGLRLILEALVINFG
jgi:hypothetical protein